MKGRSETPPRLIREVLRFGGIGIIGFLVDAVVVTTLVGLFGWGPYAARAVSFPPAVTVTWYLNRRYTFPDYAARNTTCDYSKYLTVQTIGAMINVMIFATVIQACGPLAAYPVIALACGSVAAMMFNFFMSRYFVFNRGINSHYER